MQVQKHNPVSLNDVITIRNIKGYMDEADIKNRFVIYSYIDERMCCPENFISVFRLFQKFLSYETKWKF